MDEIIKINSESDYKRYEKLLEKRDALKKEAVKYNTHYIRVFGDLILKVFEIKIECIRKKKKISYCNMVRNRGESIDKDALEKYLEAEMEEYAKRLEDMKNDKEEIDNSKSVSEIDLINIKKIYRRLAKKMHPDMNPAVAINKKLMELWDEIMTAYTCNNLTRLEELEILVNTNLKDIIDGIVDIEIPNLEDKIAEVSEEIHKIKSTDPYLYKYLLEDEEAVAEKKKEFEDEYAEYEEYSRQLDVIIAMMGE